MIKIEKIHHVAYRCIDAKKTVKFYTSVLGMNFILAISEDHVPSTKAFDPYMHVFLDAGAGNILAFFELSEAAPMGRDENTPGWVQHIAFQLETEADLLAACERIKERGIDVIGPTDHTIIKSIYFFDPNGHRIELTVPCATPKMMEELDRVKWDMLDEWSKTKRAVKHASWLHE